MLILQNYLASRAEKSTVPAEYPGLRETGGLRLENPAESNGASGAKMCWQICVTSVKIAKAMTCSSKDRTITGEPFFFGLIELQLFLGSATFFIF